MKAFKYVPETGKNGSGRNREITAFKTGLLTMMRHLKMDGSLRSIFVYVLRRRAGFIIRIL